MLNFRLSLTLRATCRPISWRNRQSLLPVAPDARRSQSESHTAKSPPNELEIHERRSRCVAWPAGRERWLGWEIEDGSPGASAVTTVENFLYRNRANVPYDRPMGETLKKFRIFISHTSACAAYADAAIEACNEAQRLPVDMRWFSAADRTPTANDARKVLDCSVFVTILGLDYGSPARDRPDCSYCELEWEDATAHRLTRLAYLLKGDDADIRQQTFRQRVLDSGVTANFFTDAADLRHKLFKALSDEELFGGEPGEQQAAPALGAFQPNVAHNEGVVAQVFNGGFTINRGRGA